jgi:hypothetical protein
MNANAMAALLMVGAIGVGAVGVSACGSQPSSSGTPELTPRSSASTIPSEGYDGPLPPLPVVQFASARPAPLTLAAYEFAARHPEVLKHMPCYCGCERNGHGNNQDCFVARRDADRRPEWNRHGIGCGISIDVALMAKSMHAEGASPAAIRDAVDRKFKAEFPNSTPTPHPH